MKQKSKNVENQGSTCKHRDRTRGKENPATRRVAAWGNAGCRENKNVAEETIHVWDLSPWRCSTACRVHVSEMGLALVSTLGRQRIAEQLSNIFYKIKLDNKFLCGNWVRNIKQRQKAVG